jgi:hypothetical protein
MQEFDWQEVETDVGEVEDRKSQSNGDHLCRQI